MDVLKHSFCMNISRPGGIISSQNSLGYHMFFYCWTLYCSLPCNIMLQCCWRVLYTRLLKLHFGRLAVSYEEYCLSNYNDLPELGGFIKRMFVMYNEYSLLEVKHAYFNHAYVCICDLDLLGSKQCTCNGLSFTPGFYMIHRSRPGPRQVHWTFVET